MGKGTRRLQERTHPHYIQYNSSEAEIQTWTTWINWKKLELTWSSEMFYSSFLGSALTEFFLKKNCLEFCNYFIERATVSFCQENLLNPNKDPLPIVWFTVFPRLYLQVLFLEFCRNRVENLEVMSWNKEARYFCNSLTRLAPVPWSRKSQKTKKKKNMKKTVTKNF